MKKKSKIRQRKRTSNIWKGHVQDQLAQYWPKFANCSKRLESEAPFLREILSKYNNPLILDAAMGIGCEVVWLAEQGYTVVGNEIEEELTQIAQKRASDAGVVLSTESIDWLDLADSLGDEKFDVVLLLGNSISLLRVLRDRKQVAEQLWRLCRKGGVVIVDERNFRYILQNRDEILKGIFRYTYKVIYCGKEIIGRPIQVTDDCVQFGYFLGSNLVGTLDMHPFLEGELVGLFLQAGFRKVELFCDLEARYNEDADFFCYSFHK